MSRYLVTLHHLQRCKPSEQNINTMPKSKRDKKISLTRVEKKKGLETKAALVDKVRSAVDDYAR